MTRLQITAGSNKGKPLKAPAGKHVRPTASKVRQALFDILRERVASCRFLDICAGTGIVGLEAISRGAAELTAVEEDRQTLKILRHNLKALGFEAKVIQGNCVNVLPRLHGSSFDLIFADPPYVTQLPETIAELVEHCELLSANGWLIIEHLRKHRLPPRIRRLVLFDQRHYGQTTLSFFNWAD